MTKPLATLGFSGPGNMGVNKQQEGGLLGPEWATEAFNFVFDDGSRLSSRKGWLPVNINDVGSDIESIGEYKRAAADNILVCGTSSALYDLTGGNTLTDRTGALTILDGNWVFQNYYDGSTEYILGQNKNTTSGERYIQKTGAGNWAAVTYAGATQPEGDVMMVAWGRVFKTNADGTVLHWSAQLDHTDFNTGAGSLDMYRVWHNSQDKIVGLAEFQGRLVIFCRNSILVYADATAAADWLDPTSGNMNLVDQIAGYGCIARDSIQNIGTDILYLSDSGVRSLGRTIQEVQAPQSEETLNITDHFALDIAEQLTIDSTGLNIRAAYNDREGMYMLSLPDLTSPEIYVIDTRMRTPTGGRRITIWNAIDPTAIFSSEDREIYFGKTGFLGKYIGTDDNGVAIQCTYRSGWMQLSQEERIIIPKRILGVFRNAGTLTVNINWAFDYLDTLFSQDIVLLGDAAPRFGVAQFAVSTFGSGLEINRGKVAGCSTGEVIKLGVDTATNVEFTINRLEIHAKIGRIDA